MAEDLDEFGIPIKKKAQPQKSADVDDFGIPIKKKIGLESAVSQSPISSTDDIAYEVTLPEEVNINAQRVNPLLGNDLQSQIPVSRQNELVQQVNAQDASNAAMSDKLLKIQQAYQGDKKSIRQAQNSSIDNGTITQGVEESDRAGNRATYLYNELLNGIGRVASGAGDLGVQFTNKIYGIENGDEVLKAYREEFAPGLRKEYSNKLGGELDKGLEAKYQNETFTSALGGLANSVPAMALTAGSGGLGAGAMFLQSYDGALESINSSEEGRNLDETTKSVFAGGVGLVTSALEKYGFDKIFKGETGAISNAIAKRALQQAERQTGGKVTGDVFTKFLDKEIVNLSNNFVKGGAKALDGALVEYGTEALQEGAQAGAELLVNKETGKPVFDVSETSKWDGFLARMNKAGIAGAIGGGLLGGVAGIANLSKSQVSNTEQALQETNAALGNENISDASKELLVQRKIQLQDELQEHADKIDEAYQKLNTNQKAQVNNLVEQKAKIQEAINDPELSDDIKKDLTAQSNEVDKQISEIKPVEKSATSQEVFKEYDKVKEFEGIRPQADQQLAEIRDNLAKEYGVESYDDIYDRLKSESNKGKGFFAKLMGSDLQVRNAAEAEFRNNILEALNESKSDQTVKPTAEAKDVVTDEINKLNDLAKDGKLSSEEFTKTHLDDNMTVEELARAKKEIDEDPIAFVENLRKANETSKSSTESKNVEATQVPKTEETVAETREESVKVEKPKYVIKGETVTPKEDVNIPTEPNVGGEAKVPSEVVQLASNDGGRNGAEDKGTTEKVKVNDKVKSLDRLAHQNIESEDLNDTASNQAREKKRDFTDEERQYNVQKRMDALRHGDDIVVEAKKAFGDEYVNGLLDYIDENGKTLTADKKQLMYVTLENDLNRQLLADPDNLTLKKQEKLVADKSRAFGRETGRATSMGQLRQLARVGYDSTQVTEDFFSPKEITERKKVEKAVNATPDDINKEYEVRQESRTDAEIEKAIESGVQKRIDEIYEALPSSRQQRADKTIAALERIQKKLRSRTYDASIGVPVALIDAGISTIKQAIKTGVKVADAIELGIAKIKEKYGKEWKNEDKFRQDMLDGFNEEKIDVEEGTNSYKSDPTVKQALIDAGYSRDINIKNKDGVKEKRSILDWKKLTGQEGSLDNINKVVDQVLPDKGYTSEEIAKIKQALKDEYNDLHASIIEKATNDLERRNTPRENNSKILARRLAELYNQGAFDKNPDTYDRLINQTLGVSIKDQTLFDEIKGLHKSLADLVDSRDANGNKLSDVALSTAEAKIKNDIKKVIQKVAFSSGNGAYKATVIVKNLVNGMQRQLLNTLGQLVENPVSAAYNDLQVKVQDAFKKGKWDTPELRAQRRMLSKAAYKSVLLDKGEEYGGVGSPFTTKNAFDDAIRSVTPNKLYQAYVSAVTGTAFLDSSDSAFKIKRTELEFTHNLIRVLTDKSNPNAMSQQEALQYVNEKLTGQSFEDAKNTAKDIIESVNKKAGKQILSPSDTNIARMANDIVKDGLIRGEKITKDLVEASFKAAYTTAGTGLGHESNNFITKGLGALNRSIEADLNDAIRRKEWGRASWLNMYSILSKNVLNPFAGGGANWTVIGLQKMGLPLQWLDTNLMKNKALDLSTVQGLKDAQTALQTKASLNRANGRTLIAGTTGLIIAGAVYGSGTDDDIKKFRKKHPVLDKYLYKVVPPMLALLTDPNQKAEGRVRAIGTLLGDRAGGFGDKERMYLIAKDLAKGKEKSAAGRTGDLVGGRFNVPYSPVGSSQMAYQVRDLYREFMGLPPIKSDFKNNKGFVKGFFKRGWWDYITYDDKNSNDKK